MDVRMGSFQRKSRPMMVQKVTKVAQKPSSFSTRTVTTAKSIRSRSQNQKVPRAKSVARNVNIGRGLLLTLQYITVRAADFLQSPNNYYAEDYDYTQNDPAFSPLLPAFLITGVRAGAIVHA